MEASKLIEVEIEMKAWDGSDAKPSDSQSSVKLWKLLGMYSTNAKVRVHERLIYPISSTRFLTTPFATNTVQCLDVRYKIFLQIYVVEKSLRPIHALK